MREQILDRPNPNKQDQMNITFAQHEKFLFRWINRKSKESNTTRAGLVKRIMMKDYQRVEKHGGKMSYPSVQTELEFIV